MLFDVGKKLIASNEFYFLSKKYSHTHTQMTQSHSFHTNRFIHTVTIYRVYGCDKSYEVTKFHFELHTPNDNGSFSLLILREFYFSFFSLAFVENTRKKFFYRDISHFILLYKVCTLGVWLWDLISAPLCTTAINGHHFYGIASFRKCDNSTINFMTLPQDFKGCAVQCMKHFQVDGSFMRRMKTKKTII